ncbi:MAG: helix-turn-helix domain-containing protein [Cyanobacteria bacterium J007]|jgi:putative transposase|nr:MAG: helix-turn-helix domain-containing protein [Cyanobacteria bacterium J007]
MPGVVKIEIAETADELKTLLGKQKTSQKFLRVQALYLLKTGQVKTVTDLSNLLGKHRVTVQNWLKLYKKEGLQGLLQDRHSGGRKSSIPDWAIEELKKKVKEKKEFKTYGEIQQWFKEELGVDASYMAVYELVRYKLKAKVKSRKSRTDR